jgi:hypothetical protein
VTESAPAGQWTVHKIDEIQQKQKFRISGDQGNVSPSLRNLQNCGGVKDQGELGGLRWTYIDLCGFCSRWYFLKLATMISFILPHTPLWRADYEKPMKT